LYRKIKKMGNPSDFLIPGIGAAANIIGGAISRGQAVRDTKQARQWYLEDRDYNSPKNQLSRMHEAGLPSAAYFGGSASSQSNVFQGQTPETDNGIGKAGESIGKYQSNRMERIATEAAQENLAILKNQRAVSDKETAEQLREVTKDDYNPDYDFTTDPEAVIRPDGAYQIPKVPKVVSNMRQKDRLSDLQNEAQVLQNKIKVLEHNLKEEGYGMNVRILEAKVDDAIEGALIKTEERKSRQTENKYQESELKFKEEIRNIRRTIFTGIRNGKIPSVGEIISMLALALENRL